MRRLLILVLLSFLLVGCSGEKGNLEKYDCYNANFGDSVEDVKSIKGLTLLEEIKSEDEQGQKNIILDLEGEIFGNKGIFRYSFDANDDSLFILAIRFEDNTFRKDYTEAYEVMEDFKEKFINAYGEPYNKREFDSDEKSPHIYIFDYDWANYNTNITLRAILKEDNSEDQGIYILFYDIDKIQELGIDWL